MSEHAISIEHRDDRSKYNRPRRWYRAVCSCGEWESREGVQRWFAAERGNEHLKDTHGQQEEGQR